MILKEFAKIISNNIYIILLRRTKSAWPGKKRERRIRIVAVRHKKGFTDVAATFAISPTEKTMTTTPEQFIAATKANLEAQFASVAALNKKA